MINRSVHVCPVFIIRDICKVADKAEKLGGVCIRKDASTVPSSNSNGLLSRCLKPADTVEILHCGGKDTGKFTSLLQKEGKAS